MTRRPHKEEEAAVNAAVSQHTVHFVGRITDVVFSFLGPMTFALAEQGIEQTIVVVDHEDRRHVLPRFHPSIRLVLVRGTAGPLRRMVRAFSTLRKTLSQRPVNAVHLHGMVPCLVGIAAVGSTAFRPALFFYPHGSKTLGPFRILGASLARLSSIMPGHVVDCAITNTHADARVLRRHTRAEVQVVESPVAKIFFEHKRAPSRRPLIVTGSHLPSPDASASFAQFAVLLYGEALDIKFNWLGSVDDESLIRLEAAQVRVYGCSDEAERAARIGAGWVYVALGGTLGFPIYLAEAMAMGMPCIVWDTPYLRDLIEHDVTGLVCNSTAQLSQAMLNLVSSPELRERLGRAAREAAMKRFDERNFHAAFFKAYGESEARGAHAMSKQLPQLSSRP